MDYRILTNNGRFAPTHKHWGCVFLENMGTCTHTHAYAHTGTHTCTHIHRHTHTHKHVHTYTHACRHTCACTHMDTHAHRHARAHAHTYTRAHGHMHTHMHMHAHTHTQGLHAFPAPQRPLSSWWSPSPFPAPSMVQSAGTSAPPLTLRPASWREAPSRPSHTSGALLLLLLASVAAGLGSSASLGPVTWGPAPLTL